MKKILLACGLLLSSFNLWSAEEKILTVIIENILQSNAKGAGSSENVSGITQDFYFDFALPQEYVFEIYAGGSKQIEGPKTESTWNDSYLQLEKAIYTGSTLKFSLSARYVIPLSEDSRNVTHMNWGMQLRPTFLFTLYKEGEMTFTYRTRPTLNETYYSQDTDEDGFYNIERTFVWANRFSFNPAAWVYFQAFFDYTTAWNSNGDHVNDQWSMTQLVGFNITPNIYLELFHSAGSKLYNDNGRRNSIDAFDSKTSNYFINLGFTF